MFLLHNTCMYVNYVCIYDTAVLARVILHQLMCIIAFGHMIKSFSLHIRQDGTGYSDITTVLISRIYGVLYCFIRQTRGFAVACKNYFASGQLQTLL